MTRPVVIGTVKASEVEKLLSELRKVGHFSLVKREGDVVSYYDGTMTRHTIKVTDKTNLTIL